VIFESVDMDEDSSHTEFICHLRHFLREFPFVKELHPVVQDALADIVFHARGKHNQILYEEGEEAEELFIVLSGEVNVFKPPPQLKDSFKKIQFKTLEGSRLARRNANGILKMLTENSSTQSQGSTPPEKVLRLRSNQGPPASASHIGCLRSGCMFGEVGLLQEVPRDCTCVCATDCELLMIKKEELVEVIKEEMNKHRFRTLAGPLRQLLRDFAFYKDLDTEVQDQVPELLRHVRFRPDSLVFKQGDPASCCYIILRGQVSLWRTDVPDREKGLDAGPLDFGKTARRDTEKKIMEKESSQKFKCATILSRLEEAEARDEFYEEASSWATEDKQREDDEGSERSQEYDVRDELGTQVATLGEGVTLGELGLVSDKPRNASAYCNTNCDFLMLPRESFDRVLRKYLASDRANLPNLVAPLVRHVPFFKQSLRAHLLESVPYMMEYTTESKGSVLFWEEDPPGFCYLIITGEVTVWKRNTDAPPAEDTEAIMADINVCKLCSEIGDQLGTMRSSSQKQAILTSPGRRNNIRRVSALPRGSVEAMDMFGKPVLHLGHGMIFGEQALVNDAPRSATITCRTDCQLLTIERSVFETMLLEDMLKAKVKQLSSTVQRLLKEFQMFSDLTPAVLECVPEIVTFITKKKGTVLFEEGDPPGQCFIVLSGEVTVWASCLESIQQYRVERPSAFRPSITPLRRRSNQTLRDGEGPRKSEIIPIGYVMDPETGEISKPKPPLVPTSLAACEKCAALASMFRHTLPPSMKSATEGEEELDDSVIEENSDPIASLGPGNLFGELALLNDNPRSATVTCRHDCEFLVIERSDFDRVIKEEMKRSKDEKLDYLRTYLPGVKKLPPKEAERLLYYFNKVAYPRHHVFLEQGKMLDGAIYCVWQGSVELYCQEESQPGTQDGKFRRLGILLRGSVFGAVPQNTRATYTVIAASAPCEVLLLLPDAREHLPNSLMYSLRDHLEMTVSRRREQCAPLAPMGGILPLQKSTRPTTGALRGRSAGPHGKGLPQARTSKMPRPLSGKLPSCTGRPSPEAINTLKLGPRPGALTMPSFSGLFQRFSTAVDYEEFDMDPGEVLALTARKPKPKNRSREPGGLSGSQSLPSLHGN